jgi:phosphatidylglycerophosphatase A
MTNAIPSSLMQDVPSLAARALPPPQLRPGARFLLSHPAHLVALGFGAGLSPLAPGTCGTLWAWLAFHVMQLWLAPAAIGWIVLLALPLGWWACTVTARHMGIADPAAIVWDEILCFWIILWLVTPASLAGEFAAFLLFRYFDAAKPGPIGWADRRLKGFGWRGGFGILADDLVAAFCTLFVIAAWRHLG